MEKLIAWLKTIFQGKSAVPMADSLSKKKGSEPGGDNKPATENESVTIADIEKLFSLMRENDIAELEIEQYKTKIHIVSKSAPAQQQPYFMQGMQPMQMMPMGNQQAPAAEIAAPQPAAPAADDGEPEKDASLPANARTILSPMVGTFYRSASPESPSFVQNGDVVSEDSVLCIIEAMKLMNEIKAETRGKILRILVENGMPVEFNQPLFILEP